MIRVSRVVAFALVTLVVCCNADPRQEQDEHNAADRYDNEIRERQELERFLHFILQSQMRNGYERNLDGIGGALLGRNLGSGRITDGLGGSSLLGRSLMGGKNLDNLGGSTLLGRSINNEHYARFVDSLGGGNFVRNLDSIGGGNLVRNLDSIGGGNLVKKNLDAIGGPNLVKRHVDSLGGGNFVRNLDSIGGGNFVRELDSIGVREAHRMPHLGRRYEYISPLGRNLVPPFEYAYGYYGDGLPKRNFDEIDRSNLNTFVKKRNFDEIDQSSMPFPFKRFYPFMGPNYLDIPVSSLDKKRYRPDYPMDEIDFSQFPIGSKRSENTHSLR
ncbi:orcokinin peptides type B [Pieris rapae]|uniref:orcokinin peptides type B n=1 Tax=Pieris rapae TaxID=64459 RepID=UPI001E27F61F|nr:orcokinin peptides type B [Pieris rapae]